MLSHFARRLIFDGLLYLTNRPIAHIPSHTIRLAFYRTVMKYRIGRGSYIFMDAWFDGRGHFEMGCNSVINQKCHLDNRGGIQIGDNVSISSEVCILTADHDMRSPDNAGRERPVHIHDYVFIGTRATILPGVTLGEGAVVGAGSVVTKDVPPYTMVAGIPARKIGERPTGMRYSASYNRLFF